MASWHGTRIGWIYNYKVTSIPPAGNEGRVPPAGGGVQGGAQGGRDGPEGTAGDDRENGDSALHLFMMDHDGVNFDAKVRYEPYLFVAPSAGHEREVELGIAGAFSSIVRSVTLVYKEDLGMVNHLSGRQRPYLQVRFANVNDLSSLRQKLDSAIQRNRSGAGGVQAATTSDGTAAADLDFAAGAGGVKLAAGAGSGAVAADGAAGGGKLSWMRHVEELREYDVKYFTRVAIDLGIFVGLWYEVTSEHGDITVTKCDESRFMPGAPRICAFDIETTKAPLKFPQPESDEIYMLSYMLDTQGFLIVNNEVVPERVGDFEYTPKPEYEGCFQVFNEPNEEALLRRWFDEMRERRPHVYVTYNGDYFDFPFIQARAEQHGMSLRRELGFSMNAEGAMLHPTLPHIDCFYWVKRDSYLPQGSHGLKAVTKAKLGYEPIEVDPEDMLPLAQSHPQRMAAYSVSDAVSTYYLYMKYVHPFIFSLCTIIPMAPDDVLRKGSGTLCESLLCVQAYKKTVIWPNKQVSQTEKFHDGKLIDTETYIGGRVEALRSGVFRSDIPVRFDCVPEAFDQLAEQLDDQLKFAIEVENGTKMEDVTNYDEVRAQILSQLAALRDRPGREETPLIYHLDVGAMYPNIILTNRLQPPSMVNPDMCNGCCFNSPTNGCKRTMRWMWKGEMFTASRHEYAMVKAQLETEQFRAAQVEAADASATTKKTYGNRRGNVLEGTTFDRAQQGRGGNGSGSWGRGRGRGSGGGGGGGGGGYRNMSRRQQQEAAEALIEKPDGDGSGSGDESDDADGRAFHRLKESTRVAMLKKRMGEYSRRAHRKVHETQEVLKEAVVCQRENSFYVDTVRLFRDRRYHYKRELKRWKGVLDKASDPATVKEAKSRCIQMESLQLAHKCILNSFYGYVMRKGSRWYSMEMAGVVTYLGASLIMMARVLVQQIGVTLELDTDGIWCCLPSSFPEDFTFKTLNPKKPAFTISYPCVMLNKDVQDRHTNHQYQALEEDGTYSTKSECSIYFEVDGPYKAMILPASREEGKGIKKRYAVFHPDGRLAELKGFELKRRGELMLVKDFQSLVFRRFLDGSTLQDAYASAAAVAQDALQLLYTKGAGYEDEEVLLKLTESSNMSRRLAEYPEGQKSLAITTARRIAEFLGPQMVKDKGLSCQFVVGRLPHGRPVTERPIPLSIFKAEPDVRVHFLRRWTGDNSLSATSGVAELLDWDYYIARFNACVQKIITIPAALQFVPNPLPRVEHPDWLHRAVLARASKHRQPKLDRFLTKKPPLRLTAGPGGAVAAPQDIEDVVCLGAGKSSKRLSRRRAADAAAIDPDVDDAPTTSDDGSGSSGDELAIVRAARLQAEAAAAEQRSQAAALRRQYFGARGGQPMDAAFFRHAGFGSWLTDARRRWVDRAAMRRDVLLGSADTVDVDADGDAPAAEEASAAQQRDAPLSHAAALASAAVDVRGGASGAAARTVAYIEAKATALSGRWHILEIRPPPPRARRGATVTVFAIIGGQLHAIPVAVSRRVTVALAAATSGESPDWERLLGAGARPAPSCVMPRRPDDADTAVAPNGPGTPSPAAAAPEGAPAEAFGGTPAAATAVYQVDVGAAADGGDAEVARLRWACEEVDVVAGDEACPAARLVALLGTVCSVNQPAHFKRLRERRAAAPGGYPAEAFWSPELAPADRSGYLQDLPQRRPAAAYLFHMVAPGATAGATRAVVACAVPGAAAEWQARVIVVQPAGAARPALNLRTAAREAAAAVGVAEGAPYPLPLPADPAPLQFADSIAAAFEIVAEQLRGAGAGPPGSRPHLVALQGPIPTPALASRRGPHGGIPPLASLAVRRVQGAADDHAVFANPLMWHRDALRRGLQRLFALPLWLDAHLGAAAAAGVPVGNLGPDPAIGAWDAALSRALDRARCPLWPRGAFASEAAAEPPRAAAAGGGVATWCVELSLAQLDAVAVIYSHVIQAGDDAASVSASAGGAGPHFAALRGLVTELYTGAVRRRDAAAGQLIVAFPRWLRCPAARCYEPRLAEHVGRLAARALGALLARIGKLGGIVVAAAASHVVVDTRRGTLREAVEFVDYLTAALRDNELLAHLGAAPARYFAAFAAVRADAAADAAAGRRSAPVQFIGLALAADRVPSALRAEAGDILATATGTEPKDAAACVADNAAAADCDAPGVGPSSTARARYAMMRRLLVVVVEAPSLDDFSPALRRRLVGRLGTLLHIIAEATAVGAAEAAEDATVTLANKSDREQAAAASAAAAAAERVLHGALIADVGDIAADADRRLGLAFDPVGALAAAIGTQSATDLQDAAAVALRGAQEAQRAPHAEVGRRFAVEASHWMALFPAVSAVARHARNNCLRSVGVSLFASAAEWAPPAPARDALRLPFSCPLCSGAGAVSLATPAAEAAAAAAPAEQLPAAIAAQRRVLWKCRCGAPVAPVAVEAALLRVVHRASAAHAGRDEVCVRCRQASATTMQPRCECGGDLLPVGTRPKAVAPLPAGGAAALPHCAAGPRGELALLRAAAVLHDFRSLAAASDAALAAFASTD